jgi:hypothetical protein
LKVAVPTPDRVAVTEYVPAVVFAVAVTLATPVESVVAVVDEREAEAPDPGAVKFTVTPDSGLPLASVTFTCSGPPNAVPTVVLCVPPPTTVMAAGGPGSPSFVTNASGEEPILPLAVVL